MAKLTKLPLYFRCYTEKKTKKKVNSRKREEIEPNQDLVLVFDTETKSDEYQGLVFGSCGIWINKKLDRFYIFYNDDLKKSEITKLQNICSKYNIIVIPRSEFVDKVFYPYVFLSRAKCIGFNLPFDLSRLATFFTKSRKHHNGFSSI